MALEEEKFRRVAIAIIIDLTPAAGRHVDRGQINEGCIGHTVAEDALVVVLHATRFDGSAQARANLVPQQVLAEQIDIDGL